MSGNGTTTFPADPPTDPGLRAKRWREWVLFVLVVGGVFCGLAKLMFVSRADADVLHREQAHAQREWVKERVDGLEKSFNLQLAPLQKSIDAINSKLDVALTQRGR